MERAVSGALGHFMRLRVEALGNCRQATARRDAMGSICAFRVRGHAVGMVEVRLESDWGTTGYVPGSRIFRVLTPGNDWRTTAVRLARRVCLLVRASQKQR